MCERNVFHECSTFLRVNASKRFNAHSGRAGEPENEAKVKVLQYVKQITINRPDEDLTIALFIYRKDPRHTHTQSTHQINTRFKCKSINGETKGACVPDGSAKAINRQTSGWIRAQKASGNTPK